MGNFASCTFACFHSDSIFSHLKVRISAPAAQTRAALDSLKTSISSAYGDLVNSLAGSSAVLSELDEAWYQQLLSDVEAVRSVCTRDIQATTTAVEPPTQLFLGPSDVTVAPLSSLTAKTWNKFASNDDDDETDDTDDESKCDYSDSEPECDSHSAFGDGDDHHDACCSSPNPAELEYHKDDDDTATATEADRLLRMSSMQSPKLPPVYVDDYLCPCGECPQYRRIACDVQTIVTWRSPKEQGSITRVLQAFSTYNEVVGYHADMIEAAEECLQLWLGDEDRALSSLVLLYDEVPQLCKQSSATH